MKKDVALKLLEVTSTRAELLSLYYSDLRYFVLIDPISGYSIVQSSLSAARCIGAGWEPVAEFEKGKQVEVHRFHLHLK